MGKPTGDHSARRKGDNGTADPKASGQTTANKDGPYASSAGSPDASGMASSSSA